MRECRRGSVVSNRTRQVVHLPEMTTVTFDRYCRITREKISAGFFPPHLTSPLKNGSVSFSWLVYTYFTRHENYVQLAENRLLSLSLSLLLLCIQDGGHWGWEASSVTHSTFWPFWEHYNIIRVLVVHHMLKYLSVWPHLCTRVSANTEVGELRHTACY